ncbi:hypothetical protein Htur_1208 [Haloterrigena turkmenica DSM 5511]|uniref:DUF8163 domain-containing protein n=1 Tax=Haloterrigena turkmenica (strain ATCC 51198 / DSM 5511 / JCM 9101 / NCIMB 13204 / VKM B-1734 / 4k) TaxID=543526 RepID=D2RP65_HALTV|nr:hypothetical protein Htur_1208 [Haloterrigena turkmenica DSM 5511]
MIGALAVLTAALALLAGPTGAVAGFATALTWYGLGTPYALAAGHVVLAAAFPDGIGLETFLLVELAFVAVLLAAVVRTSTALRDAAVVLASAIAFVGTGWIVADSRSVWTAAGTLLLVVALAAYALHRYELVSLGLVPDAVETAPDADADPDSSTHEQ